MKNKFKIIFCLLFLFSSAAMAQTSGGFGVKGGLNYNSNGAFFRDAQVAFGDPWQNLGFHFGMFGKAKLGPLFVRPELVYSQMETELDQSRHLIQRLDAPILGGVGLLGSLVTVFAGPSFHYTLRNDLSPASGSNWHTGYQIGAGLNLGRIGLDLRYERELDSREVNLDRVIAGSNDFRFQQVILGLSIRF